MMEIVKLKISRYQYSITRKDRFLDNGKCVQLISQSQEKLVWGIRSTPVLSKRAVQEISKLMRVDVVNETGYQLFSVDVL
jgi:hypothetical protein|tara:strand:- start:137 stop:376 length:240 start_codon:yes stop_codon:yes gene_type:complete